MKKPLLDGYDRDILRDYRAGVNIPGGAQIELLLAVKRLRREFGRAFKALTTWS